MEDEEEWMSDTALINTYSFTQRFSDDIESFLHTDEYIPIRSNSVNAAESLSDLVFEYDVDGVVIQMRRLNAIYTHRPYLNFLPNKKMSLIPVSSLLKKHLILPQYHPSARQLLKSSVGLKLCADAGFSTMIAVIPTIAATTISSDAMTDVSYDILEQVRTRFINQLIELRATSDMSRPTFAKNVLNSDTRTLRIVKSDQHFVLSVLQECCAGLHLDAGLELIVFDYQFGQRDKTFNISHFYNTIDIISVSLHTAVNISFPFCHLFWSRSGLSQICGRRGTYTRAMTFAECANFQSNLDGRQLDISNDVRAVSTSPNTLNFLQMYTDAPHLKYKGTYHPVSGTIACSGLLHHAASRKLCQNAVEYISTMENNTALLSKLMQGRLEIVNIHSATELPPTDPRDAFVTENILDCLCKYDVFVPFHDPELQLINQIQRVANHLIATLQDGFERCRHSGSFLPTWTTYQAEIALECLYSGSPYSPRSLSFAKHLGPGSGDTTTSRRGFLSLDLPTTCAADAQSMPPVDFWSRNVIQKQRLKRLFGFKDCIESSFPVIGKNAILILLSDVAAKSDISNSALLSTLRSNQPFPYTVDMTITPPAIADQLSVAQRSQYPFVFARALKILIEDHLPVKNIIQSGIKESGLQYFPNMRLYDSSRNPKFFWNKHSVCRIITTDNSGSEANLSFPLTCEMKHLLEEKGLCHLSTLRHVTNEFPWILPVYSRLGSQQIDDDGKKLVLLFVTCIALLQQPHPNPAGTYTTSPYYVDYRQLSRLVRTMPVTQMRLQSLSILGKFLLPGVNNVRVYRLHQDIPFKLISPAQQHHRLGPDKRKNGPPVDDIVTPEDEELPEQTEEEETQETVTPIAHISTKSKSRWTPRELAVMQDLDRCTRNVKQLYLQYCTLCRDRNLPDRGFNAFRFRYYRHRTAVQHSDT